ncbi:MAG: hypothetical protein JW836_16290 [Deltaproteobacteria bacterium]|nr:hypothetical protein [Deltaproteobacteria bacterium]
MDPITTLDTDYKFIELNRTFRDLSNHSSENDDVDISRLLGVRGRLHWSDLINEYRLIILSEAGSGKTFEIRNIAQTIRKEGRPAFFLRLEHIPRDFEDAFEVGTYETFEKWLASGEEGWLLLDSVDEARLRDPGDFELAIRKLSRKISTAKDRAHIIITGRTTAWRPKTDLDYCTTHLPYPAAVTSERDPEDGGPDGSFKTETKNQGKVPPSFKIVALDVLTPDQIEVFTNARGIEDSKAFLDAVERADAWSFTSRPQDLQELTEFWIDKGQIGTRLEIMRNSIDRRLSERDQGRAEARPFSAERARQGARLLAAVTTLAHDPTIRVPDGAENSKGIAVQSVLPDWDDKDQSTLLLRPIFDEEIYGAVRFHHRSVREYLTAEWFTELLKRETSRRAIEGLFFRNQYGLDIVVPTLRPILPWLAILDEKIRERVRKVAPEIIFEGGDPSQLPIEVRRYILQEVCEKMADGPTGRSIHDYTAVQRFANPDLTDDVRALIRQYADHEDLTAFLLRMVWIGQLAGALPEAMDVALTPTAEQYVRTAAFRAINAIGSDKDKEHVRQSFLAEAPELERIWLAELIKGGQPTEQTWVWLLACLEKSEPKEPFTVDHLTDYVTEYVGIADIELLPQLVTGLNRLLSIPPMIDRRHCEVSEKFQWLMAPACKAVERLIMARHPAASEADALVILQKFPAMTAYESNQLTEIKAEFSKLVPAWQELNRALFWFEVQRSREAVDKKRGERLTNFWQASIFGSFWQFKEDDFAYVAEEISRKTLLDDRLVALSLAFNLYLAANRPRPWRFQLKKLVAGNAELSERLSACLRPPAQNQESRRLKQQTAEWKRRAEARRRKEENYHADWKKYFNNKLDEARATLRKKPGTISNALLYLFEQTREEKNSTGRWTEYNWKTLIPKYGEEVARFYRDSTVSFWRNYQPKLRSEGAPFNQTSYAVIVGLIGLEIEAIETKDWPKNLSAAEVELACKYASFELNGFPTWFPKLFETHPKIVCDFFMQEVHYELSIEKSETETHYIIGDLSWSGQWAWDQIAPRIYDLLKASEPKNLSNLDKLLRIIQGSLISDELIDELASRKRRTLKKPDHVARWFAVWTGVSPEPAIKSLKARIRKITSSKDQTFFAMTFVTHLLGSRWGHKSAARQVFRTPEHLKSLYLLMHDYIRHEDDIERAGKGTYSPELRDDAQDARDSLFKLLNEIPGKESFGALMDIAKVHPEEATRPWILFRAKRKAEQDGDIDPWTPSQVRDFYENIERTPRNHKELAELAICRFLDLKDDLEHGDSSVASVLKNVTQETDMRKYIGGVLRDKAFGRYSIPQEEELADAKKPDLRFHGVGFDDPVPAELKLADNCSGPQLFERLENQLCGDYLRDNRSRRGIFVLVYRGQKTGWKVPGSRHVDFGGLTAALQDHWWRISPKYSNVDDIMVIGIDLTKRAS